MSNVIAFNSVLEQFLTELSNVFQEELYLKNLISNFKNVKSLNENIPMFAFSKVMKKNRELVEANDERFFAVVETLPLFGDIKLTELWKYMSNETKNVVWLYINSLYNLSCRVDV